MAKERGRMPKCNECKIGPPALSDRNQITIRFINELGEALYDSHGVVNIGNINSAFKIHRVSSQDRAYLLRKIIIFIRERHARKDNFGNKG